MRGDEDRQIDRRQVVIRLLGGSTVDQGLCWELQPVQKWGMAGTGTGRRGAAVVIGRLAAMIIAAIRILVAGGGRRSALVCMADGSQGGQQYTHESE